MESSYTQVKLSFYQLILSLFQTVKTIRYFMQALCDHKANAYRSYTKEKEKRIETLQKKNTKEDNKREKKDKRTTRQRENS